MFKNLVRRLTSWAWQDEVAIRDGIARLKTLHMTEGGIEMDIKVHPAQKEHIAHCFAAMVADSPNYTEVKYDFYAKKQDGHEWVIVTVQKGSGKTPHQLRMEAENKLADANQTIASYVNREPSSLNT